MDFLINTQESLIQELDRISKEYISLIEKTSIGDMNIQLNGKWSIYQNILHINKSNQMTNLGYLTPKGLLSLFFGTSKSPSRTTEEIVALYRKHLSEGAKSPKIFEANHAMLKDKEVLLAAYKNKISALKKNISNWSPENLEKYKMIHPIMGNLTGREMLSFTVYHQFHHLNTMKKLLQDIKK